MFTASNRKLVRGKLLFTVSNRKLVRAWEQSNLHKTQVEIASECMHLSCLYEALDITAVLVISPHSIEAVPCLDLIFVLQARENWSSVNFFYCK